MLSFPRAELEEMVKKWVQANQEAEQKGDWSMLAQFYTEDADYRWNMGPNQEFRARGRAEIRDIALGYHMKGFENWKYPYQDVFIDDQKGTVICFYEQIGPGQRPDADGTANYQVDGISGSRFTYAGNFQWCQQRDFFDLGNVKALFFEMAGAGVLDAIVKEKIHQQAMGALLPGTHNLRPRPSMCTRIQNYFAMVKIALLGR